MRVARLVLWASAAWQVAGQFEEVGAPACNCDCCSTVSRLPSEQTADLKYKCAPPALDLQTETCGLSCEASAADVVLTAAESNMDYTRYCQFKCKPSTTTVGSMCIRLDNSEVSKSFALDGNGDANAGVYTPLYNSTTPWEEETRLTEQAQQEEERKLEAASSLKASIHYDVQAVLKNRLRTEAAASVARASAAEARAKEDAARADLAAREAKQQLGVTAFAEAGKAVAVEAEAVAEQAKRDAQIAGSTLVEIQRYAKTVADLAAKDAVAEIKQRVAAPMQELAETHAKMWGWDKPKFWPQVEAVRAADPYGAQMTVAIQRMDEYERYANNELSAAKGDQGKALGLATQANAMEAQGDKMGATNLRFQIAGLINSAKGHQATAQADWNTANTMRNSVPQWQDASLKAATFASWKFSKVFTPPPGGMFLQRDGRPVGPTPLP